jgi:Tol biopolymer transport system component
MDGSGGKVAPGLVIAALIVGVVAVGVVVLFRAGSSGEPRKRSARPVLPTQPTGRIAFASQAGEGLFHIHVINADGTGEITLTSGTGEERQPSWSPDRSRIAFVEHPKSIDPSEQSATDIYVMGADGRGSMRFTDGAGDEGDPSWSPDGSRIAFFTTDPSSRRRRISVRSIGGAERAELSDPPDRCNDREPTWSPDGLKIAFVRHCGDEASALYLMDAGGGRPTFLTDFGRTPDWSPDGTRIVYTGLGSDGPSVYVMNVDGTAKRKLTEAPLSGDPEWSPDGTHIVFAARDVATVDLFIMNADGSGVRKLTRNPSDEVTASW